MSRIAWMVIAVLLLTPAAAHAVPDGEAVRLLNVQRAANGIPADLVVSPALSVGCAKHNEYMAIHGMKHGEEEGEPGYSPEGAGELSGGFSEVLSSGGEWSERANPWDTAPIHLYLMFRPSVTTAGYDDSRYQCMRMQSGRPAGEPTFYAYTGPTGRTGVPPAETAAERPYIPQQLVGIPDRTETGPNLLLFSTGLGGGLEAQEASLTGPDGPVEIRMIVESTSNEIGSGSWFRGGGVMLPVAPLRAFAAYGARVVWRDGSGRTAEQTFSFETAGRPNDVDVSVEDASTTTTSRLRVNATSAAPNLSVELRGPGGSVLRPALTGGAATVSVPAPGQWSACASSGGRAVGYVDAQECASATVTGIARLTLARRPVGRKVTLLATPALAGRRATVTVRRHRWDSGRPAARPVRRVVTLRAQQRIQLPRARRRSTYRVTVAVPRFERDGTPYRSVQATRWYR